MNLLDLVTVFCPSCEPTMQATAIDALHPIPVRRIDGTGALSFSGLVNDCWEACPTDICIVMSDKSRADSGAIERCVALLNEGFAFVGLFRFGFFAVPASTIAIVGWMDENFFGGGREDTDYLYRLAEADLAVYESEEIPWHWHPSRWTCRANEYFHEKWSDLVAGVPKRKLPEPPSTRTLRSDPVKRAALPFSRSRLMRGSDGLHGVRSAQR